MKVIMVAVSSVNGKITQGQDSNIYSWTSKEDSELFFSLIGKSNLIVMGSRTYEAARKFIKHRKNRLRVVMTRNPRKYLKETISGMLEFTSENPSELIKKLESRGYRKMLLVGGAEINALFLRQNLVNEIYLTIEPKLFGNGKNLLKKDDFEKQLKLVSVKRLNDQGTLQLKYKIN